VLRGAKCKSKDHGKSVEGRSSPSRLASSTSRDLGAASATNRKTRSPVNKVINIRTFWRCTFLRWATWIGYVGRKIQKSPLSFEGLPFYLRFAFCARQHVTRWSFLVIHLLRWRHWRKIYFNKDVIDSDWGPTMAPQSVQQRLRIPVPRSFATNRKANVRCFDPVTGGAEVRWSQSQPILLTTKRL